jgi:phosphonate transport system substrate-binding protein
MTLRNRNRRRQLLCWLAGTGLTATAVGVPDHVGAATSSAPPLRFGTTPVFLDDRLALLGVWQSYLQTKLGRTVTFVQRGSYREIVDLLLTDRLDAAWLCGYPFVMYEPRLQLVATASYRGQALYRSHLIVPESDAVTKTVNHLAGRVFAYSDPLSNSGYLVPRVELIRSGLEPDRFFRRSFFTFGHRKVVEAVRVGLAHGGAVDGYVWDTLHTQHPEETAGLKVAWRSQAHGFPPIVARAGLPSEDRDALARALISMGDSEPGPTLLQRLNIDGFEPASVKQFASIRDLLRATSKSRT